MLPELHLWIVGHSIVHWASVRVVELGLGQQHGCLIHIKVSWLARHGMRWNELLPLLWARAASWGPPSALVLQLGENDLPFMKGLEFQECILNYLQELAILFPRATIFWSRLLAWRIWRNSISPAATNNAKKIIDRKVVQRVLSMGGRVIPHPGITFGKVALFRAYGVHLSPEGNDVWLANVI